MSPDGRWVAYESTAPPSARPKDGTLFLLRVRTSAPEPFTFTTDWRASVGK